MKAPWPSGRKTIQKVCHGYDAHKLTVGYDGQSAKFVGAEHRQDGAGAK